MIEQPWEPFSEFAFDFYVPGEPLSALDPKVHQWMRAARDALQKKQSQTGRKIITAGVRMEIVFHTSERRGDLDLMLRPVVLACAGIAYEDPSQIEDITADVTDGCENEGACVRVTCAVGAHP